MDKADAMEDTAAAEAHRMISNQYRLAIYDQLIVRTDDLI